MGCNKIFGSGGDIFLKYFGDIPGMLVHYFQIILNFLYVSQSDSWLTSLLKLDKYRDISSSRWDIFLNFFGGFPGIFVHYIQLFLSFEYVPQSIGWLLPYLIDQITQNVRKCAKSKIWIASHRCFHIYLNTRNGPKFLELQKLCHFPKRIFLICIK